MAEVHGDHGGIVKSQYLDWEEANQSACIILQLGSKRGSKSYFKRLTSSAVALFDRDTGVRETAG
jgi:hypothetical protein